ncbi:MAG: deoxyhypusine synthase family protein [Chloroflexi bacterium]|nr:deoxyhypusine synthase family protein [Chloroflexota bacterium]
MKQYEQQNHQQSAPDRLAGDVRDESYRRERAPYFESPVERIEPRPGMSGREVFQAMWHGGGPVRTLASVYLAWEEMLQRPSQVVWLTIAGAYVPFGLGRTIGTLMERHFVDVLVTTPAQLTHDLTEVRGRRHYHSSTEVDDDELMRLDVNRYWNVYGDEQALNTNDDVIAEFCETLSDRRTYTPSEFFYRLGLWLNQSRHKGADGMLTTAARLGVPIFCPSPADADITSDLAHYRKRSGRRIVLDPIKEALDMVALNAAIEDAGGRAGIVTLGGGAPRNYAQQAMACAYMLERADLKRYNYGVRISLDPVATGGLSGSTVSEGKTWKKYAPDTVIAEHFGEFMGPLVQITQALLDAFSTTSLQPRVSIRYATDGRMVVTVEGKEVDVQKEYGYA